MGEKELKLSPRLQCIAELVRPGARLADVGTDHAYLPVWLLQNGKITRAVASEISKTLSYPLSCNGSSKNIRSVPRG